MTNLLLVSPGSKVAVARIAARSARMRGLTLYAVDSHSNAPTRHIADRFQTMDETAWNRSLLDYCLANKIGLVIPTRHSDLEPMAKMRSQFEENGVSIAVSSETAISICIDKLNTYEFLQSHDFPTPYSFALNSNSVEVAENRLPFIAKPIRGSASVGVHVVERIDQAPNLVRSGEYMGQKIASGSEYTINSYLSRDGTSICSIPHKRIAVQNGESVQATTARIPALLDLSQSISSALPGARGPINIQAFYQEETGKLEVIEINPRLGGGFPLADKAGGRFIEWLVQEYIEKRELKPFSQWTDGLRMMRYRDAFFDFPSREGNSSNSGQTDGPP